MQIFVKFFKIYLNAKASVTIPLIAFIVSLCMMAKLGDSEDGNAVNNSYSVVVIDEDNSEVSKEIVKYIDKTNTIKEGQYDDMMINDLLYYKHIAAAIRIPRGFGESFLQSKAEGDISIESRVDEAMPTGKFVDSQINQFLSAMKVKLNGGMGISEAAKEAAKACDTQGFVNKLTEEKTGKMEQMFMFTSYVVIYLTLMGILPIIISFNEKEIIRRILASSVNQFSKNAAVFFGCAALAFIEFLVLIATNGILLKDDGLFGEAFAMCCLNLFIFTLVSCMLLFLMSTFIRKKGAASNMSAVVISLAFSFVGGSFVKLDYLSENIKKIGRFTPNYWYSVANTDILTGKGLTDVVPYFMMELLFGVVCVAVGLAVLRFRRERE
ncbi:ABC transporter permease [Eubacterium xylanophilum]|uniref:ABC transporter permease n=1 Tax=Eubacterium xylanophilum TaxID=39497 RepID=UPI00047B8EA0|nr:ABC transporter permease [Eubacterium xylanophilum]